MRRPGQFFTPLITAEKRLLTQILGIGGIEQPGPQIAVHRVLIEFDQGSKCLLVASLRCEHQALMRFRRRGRI